MEHAEPTTNPGPQSNEPLDHLGPFDPPKDYRFEEELVGEPPRAIPSELYQGRFARKKRLAFWGFFFAGVISLVCGPMPIVRTWGLYFVPLEYLSWIGLGCILIVTLGRFCERWFRGPFRYVEEGVPTVARIRELALVPAAYMHGQPTSYRFTAAIEHRDPTNDELVVTQTSSNDFMSGSKDSLTTSFRVGDYVTAIYLPSNPSKSLRLYGFLDLRPNLGLVSRQGDRPVSLLQLLAAILGIFAFFGALCWNIYAWGCYTPVELNFANFVPAFAVGAVLLGGGMLGFLAWAAARNRKKQEARNQEAADTGAALEVPASRKPGWFGGHGMILGMILVAGSLLLGGMTAVCWALTANAFLDNSPAKYRPAIIKEMVVITHDFIFREYEIKYEFLDGDKSSHTLLSTPDHMREFGARLALAEVHEGWFGWPWIRTLKPLRLNIDAAGEGDKQRKQ
jgi:hypothetical protein